MSQPNANNDDFAFDRLVDGELSAQERRRMLAALDSQEGGWRRCATAFLEAQAMRAQIQAMVANGIGTGDDSSSGPADPRRASPSLQTVGQTLQARPRTSGWWLALAAMVLIAFGAGWLLADRDASPQTDGRMAVADGEPEEQSGPGQPPAEVAGEPRRSPPAASAWDDVVTLWVRDVDGEARRVQLPLFESGGLDTHLGGGAGWAPPAGLAEKLRESGLDMRTRRRYAPVFFERRDGIVPMIVPVDDAYVTPVIQQIY